MNLLVLYVGRPFFKYSITRYASMDLVNLGIFMTFFMSLKAGMGCKCFLTLLSFAPSWKNIWIINNVGPISNSCKYKFLYDSLKWILPCMTCLMLLEQKLFTKHFLTKRTLMLPNRVLPFLVEIKARWSFKTCCTVFKFTPIKQTGKSLNLWQSLNSKPCTVVIHKLFIILLQRQQM